MNSSGRRKAKKKQTLALAMKKEPTFTIDQLLDKADEMMNSFTYDLALQFCQRALEQDADNLRALETCGLLLLETGCPEEAKHCFGRAVELSPATGHTKYMYLGQLFEAADAVQFFKKGIEVMKSDLHQSSKTQSNGDSTTSPPSTTTLHPNGDSASTSSSPPASSSGASVSNWRCPLPSVKDISSAYCSVAEVYMTDLCDAAEAEVECDGAIKAAVEADPSNAEAWQLKASFHLVKGETEEARSAIQRGVDLWWPQVKALVDQQNESEEETEEQFNIVELTGLSLESRVSCAKMLMELDMFELAFNILEVILEEEDEDNFQVCYLLTHCAKNLWPNGEDPNLRHYASTTKIMAEKLKDADIKAEMTELLATLPQQDDAMDADEEIPDTSSDEEEAMT